jgi:hypothetical protein
MAANKTQASAASVESYVAKIADEARRKDCAALITLMTRATGQEPVMWGSAIVGFGLHTYVLAGGKQGQICTVGFSSRKSEIALYSVARAKGAEALLAKLGKHKLGKGCLYIKRLADVDSKVLEQLVRQAYRGKQA